MNRLLIFIILSLPLLLLSWRSLLHPRSHGFYRFFGWMGTLWLILDNLAHWVDDPLSPSQLASWVFLVYSVYLIIASFPLLHRSGEPHPGREDPALFHFEKTTHLVTHGIFRYIRHPMYGSLIFLTLGAHFKHPMTWLNNLVCLAAVIMYYISSLREEEENSAYFGEEYREYIKTSRMYIPFIF